MTEEVFEFDSWTDFVDKAENGKSHLVGYNRYSRHDGRREYRTAGYWNGTKTFDEAVNLARRGWPEGAARLNAKLEVLTAHLPVHRKRKEFQMSVVGPGVLDMQRYLSGHPEPWIAYREVDELDVAGSGDIVPIVFNLSASCGVGTEEMFKKGSVICTLIDLLERVGKRVELMLVFGSQASYAGNRIVIKVMVKRAQDPMDLDRITFALANSACFRRLGFSLLEQASPELCQKVGVPNNGYGHPLHHTHTPDMLNIDPADLTNDFYNESKATQWLKDQLEKYGVELID